MKVAALTYARAGRDRHHGRARIVAWCGGLENRYGGNVIVGSNPALRSLRWRWP